MSLPLKILKAGGHGKWIDGTGKTGTPPLAFRGRGSWERW